LNLTVNEKHCRSHRDNSQISIHSDTIDGPIIFDDEIIDSNKNRDGNIRVARVGRKKEIKRKLIFFVFF